MREITLFVNNLVGDIPELKPIYDENVGEYGELQEHLFMGDLTRYVIGIHKIILSGDSNSKYIEQILKRTLSILETGMQSKNSDVRDLIGASFIENLEHKDKDLSELKSYFGPALRKQLEYWED